MGAGGRTLVANVYDTIGDDAPNTTSFVTSGWQQRGSGRFSARAREIDIPLDSIGVAAWGATPGIQFGAPAQSVAAASGSGAVSLDFVQALVASGQSNLRFCFVGTDGQDTLCRDSADGTLTITSASVGNQRLTDVAGVPLAYTFGRLAALLVDNAGTVDGDSEEALGLTVKG